jgi:hypothetical protein
MLKPQRGSKIIESVKDKLTINEKVNYEDFSSPSTKKTNKWNTIIAINNQIVEKFKELLEQSQEHVNYSFREVLNY